MKPRTAALDSLVTDNSLSLKTSDEVATADSTLLEVMKQHWGYESFRPLQREAMLSAMQSRDSLTVLPTGGGKSLCYQVPAVCRDGLAVVVSPLIALMKDQVDALTECGIPAACVNSSLTTQERQDVAARVRSGELKLLFAAPERLVQPRTIDFLRRDAKVSFIAIDEAHCISNWGHDFRPEYRQLGALRDSFPDASLHAFTATATEKVRQDIVTQLSLRDAEVNVGNFDRPNLFYRVERRYDPLTQIREVIDRHPQESGVVYCISRANVESTAESLRQAGYSVLPYHAGLEPEQRKAHQEAFIDEQVDIIVATVAFGMGIDKSNVRYVVHAEMPRSIEAYQQESGRAGRDGLEAECCLFYSGRDIHTWEFLIEQSESEDNRQRSMAALKKMEAFCFSAVCRHRLLVSHFGQSLEHADCGACDVCRQELETLPDALVISQKILSSVYRQGQSFGAEYTAQVLRGSKNKRVLGNRHNQLTTYGLLKDEPADVVRGWIDQLTAQGYLQRSGEHSVLIITPEGAEVLKGETTPALTRPKHRAAKSSGGQANWEGVDKGLFEELRQFRMELSVERGVPPYVILGDVSLRELARVRPSTVSALTKIYGIGQQKKTEFGTSLVKKIKAWARQHEVELDVTHQTTTTRAKSRASSGQSEKYFDLFEQGYSRQDVAVQLDRSLDTVANYLEQYIEAHRLTDASQWVSADIVQRIREAGEQVGFGRLKPIFEQLDRGVGYDEIRIVLACERMARSEQPVD